MVNNSFDSSQYHPIIITIDGTAASGKGTVVRGLKTLLDERYQTIDAGAMYRNLTYFYTQQNTSHSKLEEKQNLKIKLEKEIKFSLNKKGIISINGIVLTEENIRGPEIDPFVGKYSALDEVKKYIVNCQRELVLNAKKGWILDGRCMGSAVAPQAQVKFFMDAPILVRATRRHFDYVKSGKEGFSTEEIRIDLEHRDNMDYSTNISPLKIPEDAIILDSYQLSPEAVIIKTFDVVVKKIKEEGLI